MKKLTLALLLALALTSMNVTAGVVDHDKMFDAYLNGDLATWHNELLKYVKNPNLTFSDRCDIANYLYGYIGFIADDKSKKKTARYFMTFFERYYEEMIKSPNYKSMGYLYKAGAYGMKSKIDGSVISNGTKSLSALSDAEDADPKNPLAIGLRGNVKFYAPGILGGDKKKAINYFLKAIKILSVNTPKVYRWNYRALQLCVVEAYVQLGEKEKAEAYYQKVMKEVPNFKRLELAYETGEFGIADVD
ncbi:MAG: hypothetical protein MJ001_01075 [Paludibacteraceae bacterium]|nr:hypothetical protein [Candidatus Colousia faecequi]MCQ2337507.1 hypothetical protein [Paludibacteraceae bacterium]